MPTDIDLLPLTLPSYQPQLSHGHTSPYVVIVYNDDWHSFEQVEVQLQKATGCTLEKAEALAFEIHTTGRAIVFGGTSDACEAVANILREIKLQVETDTA